MSKLTKAGLAALAAMAAAPRGKIGMQRGDAPFRESTICALENMGYALWCDEDDFEPTAAEITPAGRAFVARIEERTAAGGEQVREA